MTSTSARTWLRTSCAAFALVATISLAGCSSDTPSDAAPTATSAGASAPAATSAPAASASPSVEAVADLPTDGTTTITGCALLESDSGPATTSPDWTCVDRDVVARVCEVEASSLSAVTVDADVNTRDAFTGADGVYAIGDEVRDPGENLYHPWVTCATDEKTWLNIGSTQAFGEPSSPAIAVAWTTPVDLWGTPAAVVEAAQKFTAAMAEKADASDVATPEGVSAYTKAFDPDQKFELVTCAPIVEEIGTGGGHECIMVGTSQELTLTLHDADGWKVDDASAAPGGDV